MKLDNLTINELYTEIDELLKVHDILNSLILINKFNYPKVAEIKKSLKEIIEYKNFIYNILAERQNLIYTETDLKED